MLPAMSSRYASSGRNPHERPGDPSPIVAMTAATARKTQGQRDPGGRAGGMELPGAEEEELGLGPVHLDGEQPDENDQQRERDRGPREPVHAGACPQEPDADAEEAAEQDKLEKYDR